MREEMTFVIVGKRGVATLVATIVRLFQCTEQVGLGAIVLALGETKLGSAKGLNQCGLQCGGSTSHVARRCTDGESSLCFGEDEVAIGSRCTQIRTVGRVLCGLGIAVVEHA